MMRLILSCMELQGLTFFLILKWVNSTYYVGNCNIRMRGITAICVVLGV